MHILAVGINYKTAPVEIREKLSFNEAELAEAMKALKNKKSILENIIISTCNRTEIYAVGDQLHTSRYYIKEFLSEWFNIDKEEFSKYLFIYEGDGAVEHLFSVTCGLNSMILGETQILGQVRSSYLLGQKEDTIGTVFNHLFKQALTLAKKAHSETEINTNAVSVSYAAVELAKKIFGGLNGKNVLILGAGKMGELAIQNLHSNGADSITVINRTFQKAVDLAERFNGTAKQLQELQCALVDTDILITSTGAKDLLVTKEMMSFVNKLRKGRPIFMVDIAVPRDLDPTLAELENVFLYDIDDLEGIVQANIEERKKAAEKIEMMIESEIVDFNQWINLLGVVPVISSLREKSLSIQRETMESIERKLPHLSERDKKVLNKHTKSIINQMLKDPILYAKELADEPNAKEQLNNFVKIFHLEELIEDQLVADEKERNSSKSSLLNPVPVQ
ncbi:glutamyl-tRNA reductase [Peribacillus frigoritolerans]|jgi:glutamyl-tRNA reductase|uniref:Glutamyl-tRNA reductase n=1 Tax=Peribacillus frigoritolerans TaxID=450367 RepID=A0AAJ1VDH9_9BACI|nr:glutamyl-tRNA reductase [Peribacillus frigoritolerans]MCK2016984.1 glutamyl-tRNA reductase [Peribacillus frigoritolerans]MDM5285625.1 glutamyl-tRNA reductase [Peribacillus frigoritolerans]MED3995942.1 glutamyl-tRNA reductase [Peribacillus frigoritolerans]USK67994.1 glutamyl-tRNA reductase [Peribacillus frigoritolerans]